MKIAIIGAGSVGRTPGLAWRTGGHDVTLGVPEPGSVQPNPAANVVVLRTPSQGTREAAQSGSDLAGKVVIDATNPLSPDEQVAGWATGARVCNHLALRGRS